MYTLTTTQTVNLWGLGFVAAAAGQAAMPRHVASGSRWGASGWQREVIIWNLGTIASIAALRSMPREPDRALTIGYTVLSSLFAANHVYAIARESGGGVRTHLEALAMNAAAIAMGARTLAAAR